MRVYDQLRFQSRIKVTHLPTYTQCKQPNWVSRHSLWIPQSVQWHTNASVSRAPLQSSHALIQMSKLTLRQVSCLLKLSIWSSTYPEIILWQSEEPQEQLCPCLLRQNSTWNLSIHALVQSSGTMMCSFSQMLCTFLETNLSFRSSKSPILSLWAPWLTVGY